MNVVANEIVGDLSKLAVQVWTAQSHRRRVNRLFVVVNVFSLCTVDGILVVPRLGLAAENWLPIPAAVAFLFIWVSTIGS